MNYEINIMRDSGAYTTIRCPTIEIFVTELERMLQTRGRGWRTHVTEMVENDDVFTVNVGITHTNGVKTDAE